MSETKVDETKPSETKPKKMVRRSVAVALGIICIILVAGLGVVLYMGYSPTATNSVTSLQSQINQLQTWLDGNRMLLSQTQTWLNGNVTDYETQINSLNARITQLQTWLDGNITTYNSYVADHHHTDEDYTNLYNIAHLANYTVWVNDQTVNEAAGGLGIAWYDLQFPANYAGYVSINVLSASAGAWTHVIYSAYGVNYNVQINVGTSGIAYFPILPSSSITVGVGNGNSINGATQTITITYHY
jgi:hypothetical protein